MIDRLLTRARTPVDGASVAVFRMIFGAIIVWEVFRYFDHGWISRYWDTQDFHFHYVGWGWVEPLPAPGMHLLWAILGVAGFAIAIGAFYRVATIVFAVGFGYSFLLDAARYLNHFYFLELLALLMIFIPAHRVWSVTSWRNGTANASIPAWALWLLRFQIGVLYVGGGIAKLNSDWLHGQPMSMWLANRTHFPFIGGLFDNPSAGVVAAWLGLFFDLFIVFAVAWRPTRYFALLAAFGFHFTNSQLFSIGIFPYLGLAALTLFLEPDWPRDFYRFLEGRRWKPTTFEPPGALAGGPRRWALAGLGLALVYGVFQVVLPLRNYAMPGETAWNEGGHTFSWRMKLRDKESDVTFLVRRPGEREEVIFPADLLPSWQYDTMSSRPELIRQYAHHLADLAEQSEPTKPRPEVRAIVIASLNGRRPQPLIDDTVDLASTPATLGTPTWVKPLTEPLPPRDEVWEG